MRKSRELLYWCPATVRRVAIRALGRSRRFLIVSAAPFYFSANFCYVE